MKHIQNFFTPGDVDEQAKQLSLNSRAVRWPRTQEDQELFQTEDCLDLQNCYQAERQKDEVSLARLIQGLHKLYGSERRKYLQALQRVETRLIEQRLGITDPSKEN